MPRLDSDKTPFKSAQRKINVFLHRRQWKETLIFLAFVLLSFSFWYLQNLQQDYEIEITIPVRYKNVPAQISFTDTVPYVITARVKDKGSVLLNYSFGRKFVPFEINMKDVPIEKESLVIERKEIESDIYKQLLASTILLSIEPSDLNIHYSKQKEKEVPVVFNGYINLAQGFHRSGDILIQPSIVKAFAASTVLDTITEAKTTFTEIKKADNTITRILTLQKKGGVVYQPETVTITIPVEEYTDKTLEIPITVTGIPNDFTVRLFPPTAKVVSNVPMSRFKDLSENMFSIEIPFTDLEQNLIGTTTIQLTQQPEWVRTSVLSPGKIEFILEQHREP